MSNPRQFAELGAALAGDAKTAVIYADANGEICFWNAGAEALFGHSASELSGKRIDRIIPEEYRAMHWAGFNRAIGSAWRGAEGWGPIEGQHKNGARVALEVFLTPVQGAAAGVTGVLAIFRARA